MLPAKQMRPGLFILDGLYTMRRAFHATPPLQSPSGRPTGAIHGFLGATLSAIMEMHPRHVIVAREGGHLAPDVRETISADYKANRTPFPADLVAQIPTMFELCEALGWRTVEAPGYEADDVIAAHLTQHRDINIVVWTTDKDILSCVGANSFIYEKVRGKGQLHTVNDIGTKWGVAPHQIPEVLALCGDTVDNVPGVSGIGKTTALSLIQTYGTVANVLANKEALIPRVRAALEAHGAELELSQRLLQLKLDLVLPPLEPATVNRERVCEILTGLGIQSLRERFEKFWAAGRPESSSASAPSSTGEFTLTLDGK